jgi:hypothetical protein
MSSWQCAIRGCGANFPDAEDTLVHQATEHDPHVCKICSAEVPEGYFAIRHVLEEHSRAEYVRAYDAGPDDIREREAVRTTVEETVDVRKVAERLDTDGEL